MEYKISELVAKTGVPKSTILYYIKEGLLPEAKKVKANVHKYSNEHLELIKYIKYMQENMGSTNEELKSILTKKNASFSSSYTMLAPLMNTLSGEISGMKYYTQEEFSKHFDIDKKRLEGLMQEGIVIPIQKNRLTDKDAALVHLVEEFLSLGLDYSILKEYVKQARVLSRLEQEMQEQLCGMRNEENFSTLWRLMFETLFNAKEYIFNRSTYKTLVESIKKELV
ncbi:MAG: MerR family transcriptional regulator [Sulfurimonas sp.]|nr:MerR family transcriptional regulator [Sulfurimonas sp.]